MSRHENTLIKKFVHQLKKNLQTIKQHEFALIFTGLTGSGKGTLIHFLKKNKRLYALMSDTGDMIINLRQQLKGPVEDITISNKMSSDTSIPHQTNYRGEVYRDLPGFMDNRDEDNYIPQDIINSFFIHEVYEKTKNIKIIFTASKNSLNDKATQFVNSLTHFAQRFQKINDIMQSIMLVVTKVPHHLQMKHIKVVLTRIMNDLRNQIPQKTKIILQMWVTNQNFIELFKVPEKQGPLDFSSSDAIYQKIKKIPYSKSPKINNIISEHSQSKMVELEQRWNESISEICYELVKANYQEYLKKIQKIKMLNTAKSNLNYLRHKLDQLMGAQTPNQFKTRLKQVPQLYKSQNQSKSSEFMKQFEEYFDFLLLFTKIHPDIHNTPKWKQPLYKIHHNISQLVSEPWQQVHGSDIYIKGFVIESNVIQKKINFYKSTHPLTKSKVVIFAYFFIMDEDIEYSGGNLMIYAQYFIVEGKNPKIRLNGENAKDYSVLTADDNTDGQPGRPGQNGGNLLLKVYQKSDNLHQFSVDLRGGRGGKGKNGGQIKLDKINKVYINYLTHDKSLPTDQKQYLVYRQDYKFSQRNIFSKIGQVFRILATYNGQVVEFYSTEVQIQQNLDNFIYTLGGAGGKSGHSGNFHYQSGDFIFPIVQPEPSFNGQGHVQVYEGLYVKEMIFPNFRDGGKQYNLKTCMEEKKHQIEFQNVSEEMRRRVEKSKLRIRKMSNSQNSNSDHKKQIENEIFSKEEIVQMAQEIKKQIEEEQQLRTPVMYKAKYKEQIEYYDEDVIKEEDNQEEQIDQVSRSRKFAKREANHQFTSEQKINVSRRNYQSKRQLTNIEQKMKIVRKGNVNKSILLSGTNSTNRTLYSCQQSSISDSKSNITRKTNGSQPNKYLSSRLLMPKKKNDTNGQIKSDLIITQLKNKAPQWGKQVGKELATDFGTGTVQKIAKKLIDKVWQKAIRTGLTMEKQVFRQFAQTAIKSEADKRLLAELGILSSNTLKQQFAKAVSKKGEELILTQFGKQVIRDTAGVIEQQAVKHLGEDIVRRLGTHAASQAEIQIAAKSISNGTVYVEGMVEGLFKSVMFQIFLSALMASGVTDGWIIKPHFKSKKIDLKKYNCEGMQDPETPEDFTEEEINLTEAEYKFFHSSFKQFQGVFSNKI